MKIEQIRELASIMSEHGLTKAKIKDGNFEIEFECGAVTTNIAQVAMPVTAAPVQATVEVAVPEVAKEDDKFSKNYNNLKDIVSPLVGVFYQSPTPDSPAFVKVGDSVKKGDVLCIVEAMKMMNEITADNDGVIADICVANEQVVEFGQVLFKLY